MALDEEVIYLVTVVDGDGHHLCVWPPRAHLSVSLCLCLCPHTNPFHSEDFGPKANIHIGAPPARAGKVN